jgi:hypothetical protein
MTYYSNEFAIQRAPIPFDARTIYYNFFSKDNINYMSREITKKLNGVHPKNMNIIVPNKTIISVMDSIYNNTPKDIDKMIMMTISYISDYIRNEYEIEAQNSKLNIWVTNFGEETSLRQHSGIKLNEKRTPLHFNMNY